MKKTIKRAVLGVAALVAAVAVCYAVYAWRLIKVGIPEAYAAWDCATLVIEFMDTHDGAWPRSWDDLFSTIQTMTNGTRILRGHSTATIGRIAQLTRVDWDADRKGLLRIPVHDEKPQMNIITRPDGSAFRTIWYCAEPNALIFEYIKTKTATNRVQ